jgi:DNA-binding PadR family transcriptional regulator
MAEKGLKPALYYILLSLADEDRHGLAIARDVQALSDGTVRLWPATLYGSLEDLLDRGWILELDDAGGRPAEESERRRYYRITRTGRLAAGAETDRLADLVRRARARVRQRPG